ncbi:MAG: Tim44/TimA family putative adaptor protein [Sphingomonas sp.]|nr:MAG: Tim44/TimA family putative adaptor protein [Sphingomonas sp.]
MIAAFLALRLYGVLGKRTGHEQQPLPRTAEDRPALATVPRVIDAAPEPRALPSRNIEPAAEAGLRAIVAGEPGFDVAQFLTGSQAAYRMILESYWQGDEATLRDLVEAPRLLFPFARRVLADAVRDGGFPPLLLEPIDFGALYLQQAEQRGEQPGEVGHA